MTLRYSTDRVMIVRLAREKKISDAEILRVATANEYGQRKRLEIIKDWAPAMGLTAAEAVVIGKKAGLLKP